MTTVLHAHESRMFDHFFWKTMPYYLSEELGKKYASSDKKQVKQQREQDEEIDRVVFRCRD